MKYLLLALLAMLIVADTFTLNLSLATGISAKNLLLYVACIALMLNRASSGMGFQVEMPTVFWAFVVMIFYAVCTLLTSGLLIQYVRYDMVEAIIRLKSDLIEPFLFFAIFFYSIDTEADCLWITGVLVWIALFANITTVVDSTLGLGLMKIGTDDRVQGAMGEQNQYAAYIVTFLPAMLVTMARTRGALRLLWIVAVLASVAAMLMTVSRGAILATLVMAVIAPLLFRGLLPLAAIGRWAFIATVVFALLIALMSVEYGDLIKERLFDQTFSSSAGDASSGRTAIWSDVIGKMLTNPITLLTGFGWYVYPTFGFLYITHNHYLDVWFGLGLIGLGAFLLIMTSTISTARAAVFKTSGLTQAYLMAFVIGLIGTLVAIFFVNLFTPWPYIWAYVGISLRLALCAQTVNAPQTGSAAQRPARLR